MSGRREASDKNYAAANAAAPDKQIVLMLFAIWHELRHIGDLLTPPPEQEDAA